MAKSNTNLNGDAAVENASVEAAKKASKPKKPAKKNKKPLGERIRNFFRVYKEDYMDSEGTGSQEFNSRFYRCCYFGSTARRA